MSQPTCDAGEVLSITLDDAAATERAGASIAASLRGGCVVTLEGELGAGKTTFARGVLRGAGVRGPVKSPTYALVEHYEVSSLYFYHFDFYRFNDPSEWDDLGFAECFRNDSVCLIEWPARVAGLLPPPDLAVSLRHLPLDRTLCARAASEAGRRCVDALRAAFPRSGPA